MSRTILKILIVTSMLIAAIWLFRDSTTFALRPSDPTTGRGRGCYTDLEILLGVKHPPEWIRFTELAGAGILGVSIITVIFIWRKPE